MKRSVSRLISTLLALCMVLTLLPTQVFAMNESSMSGLANGSSSVKTIDFAGGDGSEENPYQVANAEQLDAIRNNLSAHYVQTDNIDLSEYNWVPIGDAATITDDICFDGAYNGNGYEISNLMIKSSSYSHVGLFAQCGEHSVIENLKLSDVDIDVTLYVTDDGTSGIYATYAGAVCGLSVGEISNCTVSGRISVSGNGFDYVGGIAGCSYFIKFSTNEANIDVKSDQLEGGNYPIGGIVGYSYGGSISSCINRGNVTAIVNNDLYCGGISGEPGNIEYCINYGTIIGKTTYAQYYSTFAEQCNVGGIAGASMSNIRNSANLGDVYAESRNAPNYRPTSSAGGIAGVSGYYSSGTIRNCYNGGKNIYASAWDDDEGEYLSSVIGRICGSSYYDSQLSDNYSIGSTLINGEIPAEYTAHNQKNGEAASDDFVNARIDEILEEIGNIDTPPLLAEISSKYPEAYSLVDLWTEDNFLVCSLTFVSEIEDGTGKIYLYDYLTDTLIKTIDGNAEGNTLNFTLLAEEGSPIPRGKQLYFIVYPDAVIMKDGSIFEGISDKDTWSFTTRFGLTAFTERVSFRNTGEYFFEGYSGESGSYHKSISSDALQSKLMGIIGIPEFIIRSGVERWDGACFGISAVTALYKMGMFRPAADMLKTTEFGNRVPTLYNMKSPKDSVESNGVRDLIHYYQLLQWGGYTISTEKANSRKSMDNFKTMVKNLVDAGLAMDESKKVCLLTFICMKDEKEFIHTVVVWSARKNNDGSYELLINDQNNFIVGSLSTMHVASDYTSLIYTDEKNREHNVTNMKIMDVTEIPSAWLIDNPTSTAFLESMQPFTDENHDTLSVVAYGNFTITNSLGETLTYNNGYLSGTMEVFDEDFIASGGSGYAEFVYTVNKSDGYTFTSEDSRSTCTVKDDVNYIRVDAENASSIVMNKASGISVQGNDLEYGVYTTTSTGNNFFAVTGRTDEYLNITLKPDGSGTIEADTLEGTVVESLYDDISWVLDGDSNSTSFTETDDGGFSLTETDDESNSPYTITVSASPAEGGSVTGDGTYDEGESVTVKATPASGYRFVRWTEDGQQVSPSTNYTFTVEGSRTLTAIFEKNSSGGYSGSGSFGSANYQIAIPSTSNGTITVTPTSAKLGEKVTITVIPDSGYKVGSITVMNSGGNSISVTDNGDGTYTFTMPASKVTVTATFAAIETPWVNPFTDVSEKDWFYDNVAYVVQNGLMTGVGNGQFNPSGTTTRGMIMTILARLAGVDTGGSNPWYQMGMEWAMQAGVSDGTGPETDITREQLATMLWRYAGEPSTSGNLSGYPDAGNVHDWASVAMIWAVENGIINGSDGKLNPQSNTLRSETAAMLTRFCKNIER